MQTQLALAKNTAPVSLLDGPIVLLDFAGIYLRYQLEWVLCRGSYQTFVCCCFTSLLCIFMVWIS